MRTIYGFSGTIVALDQITKFLAVRFLQPVDSIVVIPDIFHLTFVQNTGLAFGLFHNYPAVWSLIITVCIAGLILFSFQLAHKHFLQQMAYGFILGGAVGNWIDRLRVHSVIDFFDFRIWPVFNVADSFITVGVVLFMISTFQQEPHASHSS